MTRRNPVTGTFNCVALLDAIPDEEINTARKLREQIRDLSDFGGGGPSVRYDRIESIVDLRQAIERLTEATKEEGVMPWLHLEAHGLDDESGFLTASGQVCTWVHLKEIVTPVNIATDLNLVLVLATCFGGSFARAIDTMDRAPVLAMIGPSKTLSAGEIEGDFRAFYRTFFESSSIASAIDALTAGSSNSYFRTTAERFFLHAWAGYKREHATPNALRARARVLRQRSGIRRSVDWLVRRMRESERPHFEQFRDKYFMYDLNPANRRRFVVTYQSAESHAKKVESAVGQKPSR